MKAFPRKIMLVQIVAAIIITGGFSAVVLMKGWNPAVLFVGPLIGVIYFLISSRRYFRRKKLLRDPMRKEWKKLLCDRVPYYAELKDEGKRQFENDVRIFIQEQNIYGPRGEPVTDEERILVAASAAILCHGMPEWEWPNMRDIVVYKKTFNEQYEEGDGESISGMVHSQGPIIFSENHLKLGYKRFDDGYNVGIHELAHVMDMASGAADGVPLGMNWMATAPWVEIMARQIKRKFRGRKKEVLSEYSKTNQAEFFAVAVENFFEKPKQLKEKEPELYEVLKAYFNQDPLQ